MDPSKDTPPPAGLSLAEEKGELEEPEKVMKKPEPEVTEADRQKKLKQDKLSAVKAGSGPDTVVFKREEYEGEETKHLLSEETTTEDERPLPVNPGPVLDLSTEEEPGEFGFDAEYLPLPEESEEIPGEGYAFDLVGFPDQTIEGQPPQIEPAPEPTFDWSKAGAQGAEEDGEEKDVVAYDKLEPFYGNLKESESRSRGHSSRQSHVEEIFVKYGSTVDETSREVQDIRRSMMMTATESEGEDQDRYEEEYGEGEQMSEDDEGQVVASGSTHHHHEHRGRHRHHHRHHHRRCRSVDEQPQHGDRDRKGSDSHRKHHHESKSKSRSHRRALSQDVEHSHRAHVHEDSGRCADFVLDHIRDETGVGSGGHGHGREKYVSKDDKDKPDQQDPSGQFSIQDLDEMIRLLRQNNEMKDEDEEDEDDVRRVSVAKHVTHAPLEDFAEPLEANAGNAEERMVVLGPNHPKMKRFQEALKTHLQKQLYMAQCESKVLTKELKETKQERQETGSNLYNLQYELARQTEILTKHEKQLEKMNAKKIEFEVVVVDKKKTLTQAKDRLKAEMTKEETLIKAMKEIDLLEWCVRQAVDEYEGALIVQENVDEKIGKMKDQAEIDKRSQDYYLDKIMSHVERMEQSNAGIRRQIQAHLDEQKDLSSFINEASTEIEALQIEKVHLQRAWNETLSVIRARDDAFNSASEAVKQSKEHIRHRESELRYLNRIIAKEQVKHEQATMLLKRRQMEDRQLTSQLNKLNAHVEQLEEQLALLHNVRLQVEADYLKVTNELSHLQRDVQKPRRRYEQLCNQKRELEDKILADIQEKTAMDKIASHIAKKVEKARVKTREMEFQLVKVENEMTDLTATVERLRTDVLKKSTAVEELEKKMSAQDQVIQDQINDLKMSERTIQRKTNELEKMNRKLQKLILERGSDNESGPLEKEIDEIEKQIAQARTSCVELQEDWLKLQDKVVVLTTQREEIASANELIRKETFIMERKKQRLEVDLHSKESHTDKLKKDIELTKAQIGRLNGKLYQNQSEQTQLGRDNILLQNDLVTQLKDAEMEAVELEQEIESLEKEKEALNVALGEAHDQCLIWEKKVKLVKEVKESVKVEQESTTGALKLAIHHMKVRFHELMRVQEKLMSDLERTVDKRDLIIQKSEFEMQKQNINPSKTKLNIQRNFKKILEKNRKLIKDAKGSENDVKNTEKKIAMLDERLECDAAALRGLKEVIEQSDQKITEAAISKHKNLIELILRQKKYKILESINLCRYKPSWKGIDNINEHIAESEKRCYAIAELCDILMHQFPENALQIRLIKASIFSHVK